MKIRQGFVSNSSSSSFMLVADKEKFDIAVSKCHDFIKFMVGKLKTKIIGDKNLVCDIWYECTEDPESILNNKLEHYKGPFLDADRKEVDSLDKFTKNPLWLSDAVSDVTNKMKKSEYKYDSCP